MSPKCHLFLAELIESASYAISVSILGSFRSCGAVQDEGLVCGRGADGNAGLSEHSTRRINL